MSTVITGIDRHSPAERAHIRVGEKLLTINVTRSPMYWITAFMDMMLLPI